MNYKKLINEILNQIILNEAKSKAQMELIKSLHKKWSKQMTNLTLDDTEKIFDAHKKIANNLSPEQIPVKNFLNRHDGKHGFKKYSINNLKDISTIDVKSLLDFLRERSGFVLEQNTTNNDVVFKDDNFSITPEKVKASKQMWFDESSAMINEPEFRVYNIDSQKKSIRMGYFYHDVFKKIQLNRLRNNQSLLGPPWCITWRGTNGYIREEINGTTVTLVSSGTNLYKSYRSESRYNPYKFYFVIDQSKDPLNPDNGKFFISSIAVQNDGRYRLISMFNDGENLVDWKGLVNIYPKLENHKDDFVYVPYSENEDENQIQKSLVDRIVEINRDGTTDGPNIFWRQNYDIKKEYIEQGGYLTKAKSWESITPDLRQMYIDTIEVHNAYSKISTDEIFKAITSQTGTRNSLDRRLKIIGKKGVAYLAKNLMQNLYDIAYKSTNNDDIIINTTRRNYNDMNTFQQYGIFDASQNDFLQKDGIEYTMGFVKSKSFFVKENRTIFTAIEFSKQNVKFYIIIDKSKIGHAYIFTKKSFYKLINKPIDSNLSNIENINLNDNLPIPDEENDNIQTPQNIDFVSKYRDNQEKIFENKKYKKRGR